MLGRRRLWRSFLRMARISSKRVPGPMAQGGTRQVQGGLGLRGLRGFRGFRGFRVWG